MCCRYYMEESPELKPFVDAARGTRLAEKMIAKLGRPLVTSGEVRPTDICVAQAPDRNGNQAVFPMIWGYTGKSSTLFNARVESAGTKPLWKESLKRRRCIIPASWYYEWEHLTSPDGRTTTGDKYLLQPKGTSLTLLAGIYRIEEGFPHFAILTREPGEEIRFIHDRMPVIISPENASAWLRPSATEQEINAITTMALTDMVFEKAQ